MYQGQSSELPSALNLNNTPRVACIGKLRWNIVIPGVLVLAVGLYYLYLSFAGLFLIPIGAITITLGILTPRPFGVVVRSSKESAPKLVVDKGVLRASIYMLAFLDTGLVLKRIASSKTTIISVLILALSGLVIDLLPGGLGGALGGYAIQEFTTQRSRERIIKENTLSPSGPGDLEFPYQQIREVLLEKNRVQLSGKDLAIRISLPRGYALRIAPKLEEIFPGKYRVGDSLPAKASSKKDK